MDIQQLMFDQKLIHNTVDVAVIDGVVDVAIGVIILPSRAD